MYGLLWLFRSLILSNKKQHAAGLSVISVILLNIPSGRLVLVSDLTTGLKNIRSDTFTFSIDKKFVSKVFREGCYNCAITTD